MGEERLDHLFGVDHVLFDREVIFFLWLIDVVLHDVCVVNEVLTEDSLIAFL